MKMWKRFTQTLGDIWAPCLMGALLGTTGVLFIKLPISPTNDSTLGESIFGKNESLDLKIQLSSGEELHPKVIGSGIMGHVQNSRTTSNSSGKNLSPEKSCHCTGHLEGSTTKRPDSFFFTTF